MTRPTSAFRTRALTLAGAAVLVAAAAADGQLTRHPTDTRTDPPRLPTDTPSSGGDFSMEWMTIDGGGRMVLTGGEFDMGTSVGQHDAGSMASGCFEVVTGFWAVINPASCYGNCDQSVTTPVLNVADFTCFLQKYAAGDCYANCDESTQEPVLNVGDFTCFLQRYAEGCPPLP